MEQLGENKGKEHVQLYTLACFFGAYLSYKLFTWYTPVFLKKYLTFVNNVSIKKIPTGIISKVCGGCSYSLILCRFCQITYV